MNEPTTSGSLHVASDLLRIGELKAKQTPLMMEFPVNPDTGPFLVSSSRSVLWVTPKRRPIIRAAVRPMPNLGEFFLEVVREVDTMGREASWGNAHPWTPAGLLEAIAHVRSYEIQDVEILAGGSGQEATWGDLPKPVLINDEHRTLCGIPLEVVSWLPPTMLVVVPQDRDYLGFVLLVRGKGLAVVHNASRGMAIVSQE